MVLAASAELGLEGIVCKHLDSRYTPGLRSRDWVKTPHRMRSEFVIGGWLPGMGPNSRTVGALLVGAHADDGCLEFCGVVGAGLSTAERRRLTGALEPLRSTSPFKGVSPDVAMYARSVRADLVCDIEYRDFVAYRGILHGRAGGSTSIARWFTCLLRAHRGRGERRSAGRIYRTEHLSAN